MRKFGFILSALACVAVAGLLFTATGSVEAQKAKVKLVPAAKLKLILAKIDPEIKSAQNALITARNRLKAALNDEVFSEKGAVEGKVIDQLKVALSFTEAALKRTNLAQVIDKGGD